MDWGDCNIYYGFTGVVLMLNIEFMVFIGLTALPIIPFSLTYIVTYLFLIQKGEIT